MSFLLCQIKNLFTNRIGLAMVFVNLFLALLGIIEKGGDYSSFHFIYEPIPIKILTIINLPIIFLAESIGKTIFPSSGSQFGSVETDNFEMLLIVIFSIFQWLLFGYFCNLIFPKKLK
jgi:hypothetical protein